MITEEPFKRNLALPPYAMVDGKPGFYDFKGKIWDWRDPGWQEALLAAYVGPIDDTSPDARERSLAKMRRQQIADLASGASQQLDRGAAEPVDEARLADAHNEQRVAATAMPVVAAGPRD